MLFIVMFALGLTGLGLCCTLLWLVDELNKREELVESNIKAFNKLRDKVDVTDCKVNELTIRLETKLKKAKKT